MYPYLRFLWTFARGRWRSRLDQDQASVLTMRAGLLDIDTYGHVNNGRYLTLMDLGRLDLMTRNGMLELFFRRRWLPVAGHATIRWRRPLDLWARYRLETRVLGWDARWFYFRQRFLLGHAPGDPEDPRRSLAATATVKAVYRGPAGGVPAPEVAQALGWPEVSPELPESVRLWDASQEVQRQEGADG